MNINFLPTTGFFKSRFTYILTFISSILSLHRLLKKEKPDFIIIHLISSVPLFLLTLFNYKTKFILRVSGYPKMNLWRRFLWKTVSKKLDKIFCPTELTKNLLIEKKIFSSEKTFLLHDPILEIDEIKNNLRKQIEPKDEFLNKKKYIISIGRLTRQKNYNFMIDAFEMVSRNNNYVLVILGEGEQKTILEKKIEKKKLKERVFLLGQKKNIYPYLLKSMFFIITSDWEDPGFVIVESMMAKKIVLSSDCLNGPREIIENNHNGFLYKQNDIKDFKTMFQKTLETFNEDRKKKKILINGYRTTKKFTIFNHYQELKKYIDI